MCGIAGVYRYKTSRPVSPEEIEKMTDTLMYRGPDGSGKYVKDALGLGHRRLTILDTHERSLQPMLSSDQSKVLCYNGEVYNYLELKEKLTHQGVRFRTTSDTEVLLESLIKNGLDALSQLNGMYAFSYWDQADQRFILVRDRIGIKPLYYVFTQDGIAFASEIKALLTLPEVKVEINLSLLDTYMSVGYCTGEETLFKGIKKLPPAHYLEIKDKQVSIKAYWDIEFDPDGNRNEDKGEAHYVQQVQELFESAVSWQLRSDVPLGVFLSGGVDSSAVVGMMHQLKVPEIKTFSVGWDYGDEFDESQFARAISQQFGTEHHEFKMQPQDFESFIPDYVRYMDEPVTEAAAISLYHIAKKTREHVTVVLSGEGADEIFGGYPIYRYFDWLQNYRKIPKCVRHNLTDPCFNLLGGKWKKYIDLSRKPLSKSYLGVSLYDALQKETLYHSEFKQAESIKSVESVFHDYYQKVSGLGHQDQMQYVDFKTWLVDDLLIKADRMSMAASLELRVPFLDHRMIELAATIPIKYRLKKGETKYLLKKALEPMLPESILYRKKMGFPTPLARLFQGPMQTYVADTLLSDVSLGRGYFNSDRVRTLVDEHRQGKADHHRILWQLCVLEVWHQEFVVG